MFARILFQNLEVSVRKSFTKVEVDYEVAQVPSISFMPSHLLSLLSVGRVTGLVIDVGHTESVVMPVCRLRLGLTAVDILF